MYLFSWDCIPDVNLQSAICLVLVAVSSCRSKLQLVCCQENGGSICSSQILCRMLGCNCSLMCISLTLLEGMHTQLGSAVIVCGPSRVLLGFWCRSARLCHSAFAAFWVHGAGVAMPGSRRWPSHLAQVLKLLLSSVIKSCLWFWFYNGSKCCSLNLMTVVNVGFIAGWKYFQLLTMEL